MRVANVSAGPSRCVLSCVPLTGEPEPLVLLLRSMLGCLSPAGTGVFPLAAPTRPRSVAALGDPVAGALLPGKDCLRAPSRAPEVGSAVPRVSSSGSSRSMPAAPVGAVSDAAFPVIPATCAIPKGNLLAGLGRCAELAWRSRRFPSPTGSCSCMPLWCAGGSRAVALRGRAPGAAFGLWAGEAGAPAARRSMLLACSMTRLGLLCSRAAAGAAS
jgi:hypothetical protein